MSIETIKPPIITLSHSHTEPISYSPDLKIPEIAPTVYKSRPKIIINRDIISFLESACVDIVDMFNVIKELNRKTESEFIRTMKFYDNRQLGTLKTILKLNPKNEPIIDYIKSYTEQRKIIGFKKGNKYHFQSKKHMFVPDSDDRNVVKECTSKGDKPKPIQIPVLPLVNTFAKYIKSTKSAFNKLEMSDGSFRTAHMENRWTGTKTKYEITKGIQQLKEQWRKNPVPITTCTLTVDQRKYDMVEAVDALNDGRKKIIDILNKTHPNLQWLQGIEPHKTGYPHLHLVIFDEIRIEEQEKLKRYYAFRYKIGSYKHGLTFKTKISNHMVNSKFDHAIAFDGAINYALCYQFKLTEQDTWKLKDWCFNSVFRYTGKQMWSKSRGIGRIMKVSDSDFEKDEIGFWTVFETDMREPIVMKITYHEDEDDKEGCIVWERHPNYSEILKSMILKLTI